MINPVTRPRSYLQVRCETLKSEAKQQKKPSGPWKGSLSLSLASQFVQTACVMVNDLHCRNQGIQYLAEARTDLGPFSIA